MAHISCHTWLPRVSRMPQVDSTDRIIILRIVTPSAGCVCRYAAVATLINVGTAAALDVVDREKVLSFLQQMCVPAAQGGGMTVHADGEVDIRSCYLALATAYMLGFDLEDLADRSSLVRFIQRCQTYEVRSHFLGLNHMRRYGARAWSFRCPQSFALAHSHAGCIAPPDLFHIVLGIAPLHPVQPTGLCG